MIDDEQPTRITVLHAGTRPDPPPAGRLAGDGRVLMIGVLVAIAVLAVIAIVIVAILGLYGYRAYRDQRQPAAVVSRTEQVQTASEPALQRRGQKGVVPVMPIGNQGEWFPPDAYPPEARRRGEQGRVAVALSIDPQGRVTACTVTASSGSAVLDQQTCALASRNGRFAPATRNGVPIASTYQLRGVRWQLDGAGMDMQVGSTPRALVDHEVEVSLTPKGEITGCKVIRQGATGGDPCASAPIGRQMFPPLVRDGKPTTARARLSTRMILLPPA